MNGVAPLLDGAKERDDGFGAFVRLGWEERNFLIEREFKGVEGRESFGFELSSRGCVEIGYN